ncbi:MAG: CAP domain-containing protein [Ardenticatenaceae bacterium]|nr:CAP domain-containing protein [Ardenticatenaceae bacterium]
MNLDQNKGNGRYWLPLILLTTTLMMVAGGYQLATANSPSGGPWVDTSDRQAVNDLYYSNFLPSQGIAMNWTGDYATCDPGTTSTAYRDGILMQINYFRSMAGVPANVVFNDVYNQKAQQAALMMSVNGDLDHAPPPAWDCYTADGAEAAGSSNLGMSYGGQPFEVADYVNEHLASVGHRLWIIYPQTQEMGTGDVPESYPPFPMANALWVFDDHTWDPRPATREAFVAWPAPGYLPAPIVPDLWSLSPTHGDFTTATITMTMNGSPVNLLYRFAFGCDSQFCAPEPVIVWVPEVDWGALDLSSDIVFAVEVVIEYDSAPAETVNYSVTLFAPSDKPPVAFSHWGYLPIVLK